MPAFLILDFSKKQLVKPAAQTVDKSPTLEIRCRAFSMRKNVVKH